MTTHGVDRLARVVALVAAMLCALLPAGVAVGQETFGPPKDIGSLPVIPPGISLPNPGNVPTSVTEMNPLSVMAEAAKALPGQDGGGGSGGSGSGGDKPKGLSTAINVMLVLTVLTLVPSIMLMCTCFLRIIVVLGLLKQALGTQQLPPAQVITGLALIMTLLVMSPTIDRINNEAIGPYRSGQITDYTKLWDKAKQPLRDFMFDQIDATGNYSSLMMTLNYRGIDTSRPEAITRDQVDMICLIPAYVLSELKTAFLMGFKVYLPFLVIDMVISSLLISMSMMMLPPVLISLPFKLLLFVLVDGWQLIVGSLMTSFVTHAVGSGAPPPPEAISMLGPVLEQWSGLLRGVG